MHRNDPAKSERTLSRRSVLGTLGVSAAGVPILPSLLAAGQRATDAPQRGPARKTKLGVGYRKLGRTGFEISEVQVGCAGIRPSNARVLRAAIEQGINYLDTAKGYGGGQSERAVGQVVKEMKCRDKVFIATKASGFPHRRMRGASDAAVEKEVRRFLRDSLERLQTDYVDVFYIPHGAEQPENLTYDQLWKALDKIKKEGIIRATAFSTHANYKACCEAAIEDGRYDVILTVINAATTDAEVGKAAQARDVDSGRRRRRFGGRVDDMAGVVEGCAKKGIGLIAMKAAQPGFLPGGAWAAGVEKYGKGLGLSDHQVLYRKALSEKIASVNVGMNRMDYLDEALDLAETLAREKKVRRG